MRAAARRDLGKIAEREAEPRGIERMELHERLGVMAREPRRLARPRHRVPLVADAARVEHERIVAARAAAPARAAASARAALCRSA